MANNIEFKNNLIDVMKEIPNVDTATINDVNNFALSLVKAFNVRSFYDEKNMIEKAMIENGPSHDFKNAITENLMKYMCKHIISESDKRKIIKTICEMIVDNIKNIIIHYDKYDFASNKEALDYYAEENEELKDSVRSDINTFMSDIVKDMSIDDSFNMFVKVTSKIKYGKGTGNFTPAVITPPVPPPIVITVAEALIVCPILLHALPRVVTVVGTAAAGDVAANVETEITRILGEVVTGYAATSPPTTTAYPTTAEPYKFIERVLGTIKNAVDEVLKNIDDISKVRTCVGNVHAVVTAGVNKIQTAAAGTSAPPTTLDSGEITKESGKKITEFLAGLAGDEIVAVVAAIKAEIAKITTPPTTNKDRFTNAASTVATSRVGLGLKGDTALSITAVGKSVETIVNKMENSITKKADTIKTELDKVLDKINTGATTNKTNNKIMKSADVEEIVTDHLKLADFSSANLITDAEIWNEIIKITNIINTLSFSTVDELKTAVSGIKINDEIDFASGTEEFKTVEAVKKFIHGCIDTASGRPFASPTNVKQLVGEVIKEINKKSISRPITTTVYKPAEAVKNEWLKKNLPTKAEFDTAIGEYIKAVTDELNLATDHTAGRSAVDGLLAGNFESASEAGKTMAALQKKIIDLIDEIIKKPNAKIEVIRAAVKFFTGAVDTKEKKEKPNYLNGAGIDSVYNDNITADYIKKIAPDFDKVAEEIIKEAKRLNDDIQGVTSVTRDNFRNALKKINNPFTEPADAHESFKSVYDFILSAIDSVTNEIQIKTAIGQVSDAIENVANVSKTRKTPADKILSPGEIKAAGMTALSPYITIKKVVIVTVINDVVTHSRKIADSIKTSCSSKNVNDDFSTASADAIKAAETDYKNTDVHVTKNYMYDPSKTTGPTPDNDHVENKIASDAILHSVFYIKNLIENKDMQSKKISEVTKYIDDIVSAIKKAVESDTKVLPTKKMIQEAFDSVMNKHFKVTFKDEDKCCDEFELAPLSPAITYGKEEEMCGDQFSEVKASKTVIDYGKGEEVCGDQFSEVKASKTVIKYGNDEEICGDQISTVKKTPPVINYNGEEICGDEFSAVAPTEPPFNEESCGDLMGGARLDDTTLSEIEFKLVFIDTIIESYWLIKFLQIIIEKKTYRLENKREENISDIIRQSIKYYLKYTISDIHNIPLIEYSANNNFPVELIISLVFAKSYKDVHTILASFNASRHYNNILLIKRSIGVNKIKTYYGVNNNQLQNMTNKYGVPSYSY